jgi:hypothetical protein
MIRDGRMPSPKEAKAALKARREKRLMQPAQVRRREARDRVSRLMSEMLTAEWQDEHEALPLWEALADVFDFTDPELWKCNTFASLRPRLIIHMTAKIAQLECDIADNGLRRPRIGERYSKEHEEHCRRIGERLDRAHAILRALTESEDHK